MAEQRRIPAPCTKDELVGALTEILEGVRTGDTLEGSIEFLLPYPPAGDPEDADFMVMASYRVGNRLGQGGLRMVGEWKEAGDVD